MVIDYNEGKVSWEYDGKKHSADLDDLIRVYEHSIPVDYIEHYATREWEVTSGQYYALRKLIQDWKGER